MSWMPILTWIWGTMFWLQYYCSRPQIPSRSHFCIHYTWMFGWKQLIFLWFMQQKGRCFEGTENKKNTSNSTTLIESIQFQLWNNAKIQSKWQIWISIGIGYESLYRRRSPKFDLWFDSYNNSQRKCSWRTLSCIFQGLIGWSWLEYFDSWFLVRKRIRNIEIIRERKIK